MVFTVDESKPRQPSAYLSRSVSHIYLPPPPRYFARGKGIPRAEKVPQELHTRPA